MKRRIVILYCMKQITYFYLRLQFLHNFSFYRLLWSFSSLIKVFKELKEKLSGTLLIISHQERILDIADEIVVVADGKVEAHGPKDEILPNLFASGGCSGCCPAVNP